MRLKKQLNIEHINHLTQTNGSIPSDEINTWFILTAEVVEKRVNIMAALHTADTRPVLT